MRNLKKSISAVCFFLFIVIAPTASMLIPDKTVSKTERRELASAPKFTMAAFFDGSYMKNLETYFLEQFPARDALRTIKAETEVNLFGKKDANGYFKTEDGIFKLETDYNEKNVIRAANAIQKLSLDTFSASNCYYAIIPSKNYYLSETEKYPVYNEELLKSKMKEIVTAASYVDFYDKLTLDDYYKTDLHWKQENIAHTAKFLLGQMHTPISETIKNPIYRKNEISFFGAYAAASSFLTEPDFIYFYESDMIKQMQVYDYEKEQYVTVYAPEKLGGMDDYDFYLWGARALLRIENPNSTSEKNLLIFRDSFGSSIAPYLAESYANTTLVDLRYVSASYAMELLSEMAFDDVLFLYSASILNHSDSLRF